MRAIYKGVIANVTDDTGAGLILDGELYVSFADLGLVIDPTDAQLEAARNGEEIPLDDDETRDIAGILAPMGDNPTVAEAIRLWGSERSKAIQRRGDR